MLLEEFSIRGIELPNRMVLGPMQMYMSRDGFANDWHVRHLSTFARGGFGAVYTEAIAIDPAGRATHHDLGAWSEDHVAGLTTLAEAVKREGSVPVAQIWHAGVKASRKPPYDGLTDLNDEDAAQGTPPWLPVGPSTLENGRRIHELTADEIEEVKDRYVQAARRCDRAGFEAIELHGAHGYLLHSFYSPLTNRRTDAYGGDRNGRMRFILEVAEAVRAALPEGKPLFVRLSCVDEQSAGWSIGDSIVLAQALRQRGVDLIDCSSGGSGTTMSKGTQNRRRPAGFQVPYASRIRREAGMATMAVGMIRDAVHADALIRHGHADLVCIAREALFNPFWALHAAVSLESSRAYDRWPSHFGAWLRRRTDTFDEDAPPVGMRDIVEFADQ